MVHVIGENLHLSQCVCPKQEIWNTTFFSTYCTRVGCLTTHRPRRTSVDFFQRGWIPPGIRRRPPHPGRRTFPRSTRCRCLADRESHNPCLQKGEQREITTIQQNALWRWMATAHGRQLGRMPGLAREQQEKRIIIMIICLSWPSRSFSLVFTLLFSFFPLLCLDKQNS